MRERFPLGLVALLAVICTLATVAGRPTTAVLIGAAIPLLVALRTLARGSLGGALLALLVSTIALGAFLLAAVWRAASG